MAGKEPVEEREEEELKQPGKEEAPLRNEKPIRIEPIRLRPREGPPPKTEAKVEGGREPLLGDMKLPVELSLEYVLFAG